MIALPSFLVVLAVLHAFGDRLSRASGLESERPLERFGISIALSLAVVTVSVFVLALARGVNFWTAWLLVAVLGLAAGRSWLRTLADYRTAWKALRPANSLGWVLAAPAVAIVALGAVAALAPPTGIDTLLFHFVAVRRMLQEGGLVSDPSQYFHRTGGFYFPYLLAFALQGDLLAKLLNFAAGAAAVGLAGATAERLRPGAGAPAASAAALAPVVAGYLGSEYLELPALLYVSAAVHSAVRHRAGHGIPWSGAALGFLGFALGIKPGLFPVALLGLPVLYDAWTRDRSRAIPSLLAGAVVALVAAGFWPAWNLASMGNVFPTHPIQARPGSAAVSLGGRISAVLTVLGELATSPPYWIDGLGPLLVIGAVGAAVLNLKADGRRLALQAAMLVTLYLGTLTAFVPRYLEGDITTHGRYLSPGLVALMAPAAGLLVAEGCRAGGGLRRAALAALFLPAAVLLPLKGARSAIAVPVAFGLESSDSYLSRRVETYEACQAVNALPDDVHVLPLVLRPYHVDRRTLDPSRMGPEDFSSSPAFVQALRLHRVTHVLVEPGYYGTPVSPELLEHPSLREVGEGWPYWGGRRIRLYTVAED